MKQRSNLQAIFTSEFWCATYFNVQDYSGFSVAS